jgi:hypothetical protein
VVLEEASQERQMSRTIAYACDRCGVAITQDRNTIELKAGDMSRRYDDLLDLCKPCTDLFVDWLRSGQKEGGSSGS